MKKALVDPGRTAMKPSIKEHTRLVATALFVALACSLTLSGWLGGRIAPVAAANPGRYLGTKIVDVDRQHRLDAVTITKVTVAGQEVQPGIWDARGEEERGTPFQADEDWLKNMSISLLNRTDKAIICAEVELLFPDTGRFRDKTGDISTALPITMYTITVGQRPESSLYYKDGSKIPPDPTKKPMLLAPGQTLVINVSDHLDAIQSMVEGLGKIPFSQVTRIYIRRNNFYFVDGMRWDGVYQGYYVPDPAHPGHYTKLDRTYFPGHMDQGRPPE